MVTHVCIFIQIGILEDHTIEEKCLTVICEAAEQVLCSESFHQISVGTLEKIVKEDRLEAQELKVFQACIKWAEVQCQKMGVEVRNELVFFVSY